MERDEGTERGIGRRGKNIFSLLHVMFVFVDFCAFCFYVEGCFVFALLKSFFFSAAHSCKILCFIKVLERELRKKTGT